MNSSEQQDRPEVLYGPPRRELERFEFEVCRHCGDRVYVPDLASHECPAPEAL